VAKKEDELPLYQLKWRGNQPNYRIYQPKWRENQPNHRVYQPKWRGNQPNYRYISQSGKKISQTTGYISQITDISAKPNKTPTKKPSSNPIGRAFFIITPKRISSRAYLLAYNI